MSADAIFNTTQALTARLQVALTASTVPGTVFVGPLDDPDATGAALILFLYRVMPNASLRNRERRLLDARTPPQIVVYRDSLPLDLYFLITVGTRPGQSEEPLLRALGYAIRELQVDPDLTGPAVNHETVHVSLEPLSTDEISRVWNLFPAANYRTSVAYVASPVWIDPAQPAAEAAPVGEDSVRTAPGGTEGPP
ncbi:DUF4255 domain-containing protein [Variovorax sp. J31P179]|uniref:DUF4255 domain-containing protein n=1 Tax=Variovorax sp. J31P179 TaxID=3053508 RepID=UPI0025751C79|nr:DUF4255 domain-containing protein [Variovorax sp. J31P179]MDM0085079.1 DUF4255 domain-containing protein [Variovorax sp. J31P179]